MLDKIKTNIQNTLILFLAVILMASIAVLLMILETERSRFAQYTQEIKKQRQESFDGILEINSNQYSDIIYEEYAQWDEMEDYIHNPIPSFTQINIDWLVDEGRFDGLWIIPIDSEILYSRVNKNITNLPFDFDKLRDIFYKVRERSYFSLYNGRVVEIYGSTIHRSADDFKTGDPQGYFIAVRIWTENLLKNIEKVTNSKITVHSSSNFNIDDTNLSEGNISYSKQIYSWDNEPAAVIEVMFHSKFLEAFWSSSNNLLLLYIALIIFLILSFWMIMKRFITTPLKRIINSLDNNDATTIADIRQKKNEFGKIADLINRFFIQKKELKILIEKKNKAEEEERKRISRELHDAVGQILMSTKLKLDAFIKNSSQDCNSLSEVKEELNKVGTELSSIIQALHPVDLERYGLEETVRNLCHNLSDGAGFPIQFKTYSLNGRIGYKIELTLYRIIQEALKNIIEHAEASEAIVEIYRRTDSIYITIADNGKGFDIDKIYSDNISNKGNGLVNIRYRTEIIDGHFKIESSKGHGTEIHIEFPIREQ